MTDCSEVAMTCCENGKLCAAHMQTWLNREQPWPKDWPGVDDPKSWQLFEHPPCVCQRGYVLTEVPTGWRMVRCVRCLETATGRPLAGEDAD